MLFMALVFTSYADTGKNQEVKALLTSVTLSLGSITLEVNDTTQAKVTAYYNDNSSEELTNNVTWIISNETIVSIDEVLQVKALSTGTSTIQAKVAEMSSSTISLEVLSLDTVAPTITLNGSSNITLIKDNKYVELNATAVDNRNGVVFVAIEGIVDTTTIGIYSITYSATDSSGNRNSKTRTVNVVPIVVSDTTPPVITLNGKKDITITQGDIYNELGATALDDVDGNVSVNISGSVDTTIVGVYTLTYTATDSANNIASKTRTVNVEGKINKLKTLTLSASQTKYTRKLSYYGKNPDGKVINYYAGVPIFMQVFATFENGDKEEVTDKIEWILSNNTKTPYGSVVLTKEGKTTVQAQYQNLKSNAVELTLENYETTSKHLIKYTVYDSHIPGRGVDIRIALAAQPLKPVTLRLELDPKDKVEFKNYRSSSAIYTKTLTFKPGEYRNGVKSVEIEDKDENNTNSYVIKTHVLESEDTNYGGKDPQDINFEPKREIEFVVPPIAQRRGALRGVHISMLIKAYATSDVVFRLVDPPEGMYLSDGQYSHILDQEEMSTKRPKIIEWDVPMDAIEGETYEITVEVTDAKKRKGSITFPIKVPKTKSIQTEIVNNELIVTDKDSTLYGMKMKGHSGEDISELKLRSVDYGDVWKKFVHQAPEDIAERIVFVMDNMPKALDVKMPEWMDTYEERRELKVTTYRCDKFSAMYSNDSWDKGMGTRSINYNDTHGYYISTDNEELGNIFMIIIKSQRRN
jgi:hypothetical protein